MKYLGAHVSTEGGVFNAVRNALEIEAKAFAMFVKNQRQWAAKPLEKTVADKFKAAVKENKFSNKFILPHAGYLINLGHPNPENRKKSTDSFIDELKRCRTLGLIYLNIHPGSHLGEISPDMCIGHIAESIDLCHEAVPEVKIVLENTAGQGSNLGCRFEQIADIIKRVSCPDNVGVCLDTCHTFASGYDIKDPSIYEDTFSRFGDIVGFENLDGIHLNDSKVPMGSRKDRHESIGKGFLGIEFFNRFMNDSRFDDIPIILETIDDTIWKEEIRLLYSMIDNN